MKRPKRIHSRLVRIIILLVAAAVLTYGMGKFTVISRTHAIQSRVKALSVSFSPLVPRQLPSNATFESEPSSFDSTLDTLQLRWVFPAETLPGQGTIILYQSNHILGNDVPSLSSDVSTVHMDTQYGGVDATIGNLSRAVDVPSQPGQRAIQFPLQAHDILIVSYALSDKTLVRVAQSLTDLGSLP